MPEPPSSFGVAGQWAGWAWGWLSKPFSFFLDADTWTGGGGGGAAGGDYASEPMSRFRWLGYKVAGLLTLLFDAYLTQFILLAIFASLGKRLADEHKIEGAFAFGASVGGATLAGCFVFTLFLSFIQNMLFMPRKSAAQKFFILVAFATNIAFDFYGWGYIFGHTDRLEWFPVWPFYAKGIEWGSVVLYIGAMLVAVGPELMRAQVKRAKLKPLFSSLPPTSPFGKSKSKSRSPRQAQQGQGQGQYYGGYENGGNGTVEKDGVWIQTSTGLQYIEEDVLRQRAAQQARGGAGKGSGGGGGGRR